MFTHPQDLTAEQRRENNAALQDRIANVMGRVGADPRQTKRVRNANTRDAATARQMAAKIRNAS